MGSSGLDLRPHPFLGGRKSIIDRVGLVLQVTIRVCSKLDDFQPLFLFISLHSFGFMIHLLDIRTAGHEQSIQLGAAGIFYLHPLNFTDHPREFFVIKFDRTFTHLDSALQEEYFVFGGSIKPHVITETGDDGKKGCAPVLDASGRTIPRSCTIRGRGFRTTSSSQLRRLLGSLLAIAVHSIIFNTWNKKLILTVRNPRDKWFS